MTSCILFDMYIFIDILYNYCYTIFRFHNTDCLPDYENTTICLDVEVIF